MRSEDRLQVYGARFLDLIGVRHSSVEHGRVHAGTPEQRGREWQRLANKGVKKGLMDAFILMPGRLIWIEYKAGKNGMTDEQRAWAQHVAACGFDHWEIRSVTTLAAGCRRAGLIVTDFHYEQALGWDRTLASPVIPTVMKARKRIAKRLSKKAQVFGVTSQAP
jgi:hypothetical protein